MSAFDARMAELTARFVARALADRDALAAAVRDGDAAAAVRISHGLAGNGGLFGFPELSESAARLEEKLVAAPDAQANLATLSRELLAQLDQLA